MPLRDETVQFCVLCRWVSRRGLCFNESVCSATSARGTGTTAPRTLGPTPAAGSPHPRTRRPGAPPELGARVPRAAPAPGSCFRGPPAPAAALPRLGSQGPRSGGTAPAPGSGWTASRRRPCRSRRRCSRSIARGGALPRSGPTTGLPTAAPALPRSLPAPQPLRVPPRRPSLGARDPRRHPTPST